MQIDDRRLERIKWRSRRGLLELDLYMTRLFANQSRIDAISAPEWDVFEEVLRLPDNDLLDMVMNVRAPEPVRFKPIIELIQSSRQSLSDSQ
jgi:antitoxin CptB